MEKAQVRVIGGIRIPDPLSVPNLHYSPEELSEIIDFVCERLEITSRELKLLKPTGENTSHNFNESDHGKENLTIEEREQSIRQFEIEYSEYKLVLISIGNGSFGLCRKTGKFISKDRMRALKYRATTAL